jgi:hypothetical protein
LKLSQQERKVVELLRELDEAQREEVLGQIRRRLGASRIVAKTIKRIGKLRRVNPILNARVEHTFGFPPGSEGYK